MCASEKLLDSYDPALDLEENNFQKTFVNSNVIQNAGQKFYLEMKMSTDLPNYWFPIRFLEPKWWFRSTST